MFQTIELTLSGASGNTATCPLHLRGGGVRGSVSPRVLCIQNRPLGQTASKTSSNRQTGERAAPSSVLGKRHVLDRQETFQGCPSLCKPAFLSRNFLKRFYLFIFRERGREAERERNSNARLPLTWLPRGSHWGPGPQPRHVL